MTVTTPALAVHYRLMERLPVRTHLAKAFEEPSDPIRPTTVVCQRRRTLIARWLRRKHPPTVTVMAAMLRINRFAVYRYIRKIEGGA